MLEVNVVQKKEEEEELQYETPIPIPIHTRSLFFRSHYYLPSRTNLNFPTSIVVLFVGTNSFNNFPDAPIPYMFRSIVTSCCDKILACSHADLRDVNDFASGDFHFKLMDGTG